MSQKYATFDPTSGVLTARYDSAVGPAPNGATPLDDATFQRTIQEQDGTWTLVAGVVTKVMPTAAQVAAVKWAAYQQQAMVALSTSDRTMHRCVENSVAVPTAWAAYRKALRLIIQAPTGDPTQPLPARPAYPAGT